MFFVHQGTTIDISCCMHDSSLAFPRQLNHSSSLTHSVPEQQGLCSEQRCQSRTTKRAPPAFPIGRKAFHARRVLLRTAGTVLYSTREPFSNLRVQRRPRLVLHPIAATRCLQLLLTAWGHGYSISPDSTVPTRYW